jgi:hypothetical protein
MGETASDSENPDFTTPDSSASSDQPATNVPLPTDVAGVQLRKAYFRRRRIILLAILGIVAIAALIIQSGSIDAEPESQLAILTSVQFGQMVITTKHENQPLLQVTEFAVSDEMMHYLNGQDHLETVIFDQGAVTDAAIPTLAALPKLQHLRLRESPITDEGMRQLVQCKTLLQLNLPHANCTVAGVEALEALPKLRMLRIGSPELGNEVTRAIANIQSLRAIHLIGIPVTNDGLRALASLPQLESLYLDDSAVTVAGWEWLFKTHPEIHVHVDQEHHDRDPKAHAHHD